MATAVKLAQLGGGVIPICTNLNLLSNYVRHDIIKRVKKMELKDIMKELPEGYKEACWATKAMSRKKGIQDEETLLTLCLYYAYD